MKMTRIKFTDERFQVELKAARSKAAERVITGKLDKHFSGKSMFEMGWDSCYCHIQEIVRNLKKEYGIK